MKRNYCSFVVAHNCHLFPLGKIKDTYNKTCFGKGRRLFEINIAIFNAFFSVLRVVITKFYSNNILEKLSHVNFQEASNMESKINITTQLSILTPVLSLISNS